MGIEQPAEPWYKKLENAQDGIVSPAAPPRPETPFEKVNRQAYEAIAASQRTEQEKLKAKEPLKPDLDLFSNPIQLKTAKKSPQKTDLPPIYDAQ